LGVGGMSGDEEAGEEDERLSMRGGGKGKGKAKMEEAE
jgi:hypothetical protein